MPQGRLPEALPHQPHPHLGPGTSHPPCPHSAPSQKLHRCPAYCPALCACCHLQVGPRCCTAAVAVSCQTHASSFSAAKSSGAGMYVLGPTSSLSVAWWHLHHDPMCGCSRELHAWLEAISALISAPDQYLPMQLQLFCLGGMAASMPCPIRL